MTILTQLEVRLRDIKDGRESPVLGVRHPKKCGKCDQDRRTATENDHIALLAAVGSNQGGKGVTSVKHLHAVKRTTVERNKRKIVHTVCLREQLHTVERAIVEKTNVSQKNYCAYNLINYAYINYVTKIAHTICLRKILYCRHVYALFETIRKLYVKSDYVIIFTCVERAVSEKEYFIYSIHIALCSMHNIKMVLNMAYLKLCFKYTEKTIFPFPFTVNGI